METDPVFEKNDGGVKEWKRHPPEYWRLRQAKSCGMWGDVSNCRVAALHGVPVGDLPGLHGWHLKPPQPGAPGAERRREAPRSK